MNEKAITMKKEISVVANHRALVISKGFLTYVLLITALYLGLRRLTASPLYILLFLILLPNILSFAAKDYGEKSQSKLLQNIINEQPFLLGTLKKKYKYTKLHYTSNSISYLISIILIGLWQYSFNTQYYLPDYIKYIPAITIASGLAVRLVGIVFYQLKFRYDLINNRIR